MAFTTEEEIKEEKNEEVVAEQPVVEPVVEVKPSNEVELRYACESCSGIAFYAKTKLDASPAVCRNCGAEIMRVLEERFIPLTQNEKDSLKVLAQTQ